MISISDMFYRIAFAGLADGVLNGAIHPEGRFHHDGQPALYASPSPQSAAVAIDIYLRADDPPRVLVALDIRSDRIIDLRDDATTRRLGIDPAWPSCPWADQRARGEPATSWKVSDAVRGSGADGMIYASRSVPSRWHLVLFRWNRGDGAQVRQHGAPVSWKPAQP
ncbi:RES family NAD+ phosphorylase [Yoonia sp. SS1-5]|uniref:RES family NAD+ phosphorylase n=1 Tax=Yoonia rhodophyticola TaxID=3137370 RepID=A0AAN0M9F7_9RHOB